MIKIVLVMILIVLELFEKWDIVDILLGKLFRLIYNFGGVSEFIILGRGEKVIFGIKIFF